MGYTDSLMASGERAVRRAHQHWFMLVWDARYGVLALVIALVLLLVRVLSNVTGPIFDILGWVTLVVFIVGILRLVWGYLRYRSQEYTITNRRLIHSEGVVNKKATDSSLEKINDAILSESLFGRIFGFGTLEVLTASEDGNEILRMLKDAKDFKKAMLDAKHELEIELTRPTMPPMRAQEAPAAPVAVPVAPTAPSEPEMTADEVSNALDRLADLRTKGLVTPEEFEAKRKELLGRL